MAWDDLKFVRHFYFGDGKAVKLRDIGLFNKVKAHSDKVAISKFKNQIEAEAKSTSGYKFTVSFKNAYDFKPVVYSLGGCTLIGKFNGGVCPWIGTSPQEYWVEGEITVSFSDQFTDPLSIIERLYGSSDSPEAPEWLRNAANLGGKAYSITDQWSRRFKVKRVR